MKCKDDNIAVPPYFIDLLCSLIPLTQGNTFKLQNKFINFYLLVSTNH